MKRHQLHVRITSYEYQFLSELAASSEDTIATLVRRLIRAAIRARERVSSNQDTRPVPSSLPTEGNRRIPPNGHSRGVGNH